MLTVNVLRSELDHPDGLELWNLLVKLGKFLGTRLIHGNKSVRAVIVVSIVSLGDNFFLLDLY